MLTAAAGLTVVSESPAAAAIDWYRVSNKHSGKCIDNYARTQNIYQYPCNTTPNQLWTWYQVPGRPDSWYVENIYYYGCLATTGNGNSASIVLRDCYSGQTSSMWRWIPISGGWYGLQNVASGRCLDVPSGSQGIVQLIQYDCRYGASQLWKGELRYTG